MRLEIPFDAAEILNKTTLKVDRPDVWTRYLNRREIRFGHRLGARVYTPLGCSDLGVIRDYFSLWLNDQELIPDNLRDKKTDFAMREAKYAASILTHAIEMHACQESHQTSAMC
jgi:hypothetical protein